MKVLVIVAHPDLESSVINRAWIEELRGHADVTVHDLYTNYPDEQIDVEREQRLCEQHDRIVMQFPFYWYSSPPLLKKWQDKVLTYGWAYGSGGDKLHHKELMLAVSTGGVEEKYRAGGTNQFTTSELLRPFQATSNLIGMTYLPAYLFYGTFEASAQDVRLSAEQYAKHILTPVV
ncbi:NAD(P)H-dependent oxidoreductase [Paenibacillus taiwanensis]|uniref:NAD(P)H-dependent oxidoreductase n=1 Tax=Paenibacillus taiwanensis TaxID=401638 RepID=UPI0003FAA620|nr:NAD(P)H-dependent oxidoreductase [Paenibacillus taiwanensis]